MPTILIADDPAGRADLVAALLGSGHRAVEAGDTDEAVARAREDPPALVVAAAVSRAVDGFDLAGQLRDDPGLADVPVLFTASAVHARSAGVLARAAGAAGVLVTPHNPAGVAAAVAAALGRRPTTPGEGDGPTHVLELVATGTPLPEVLAAVVTLVEEQLPGGTCSILLLDPDGVHLRHGAAPGLPAAYNAAVDGLAIGPGVGSCGTAAFRKEPVVVADIAADPLWEPYRDLARTSGLRACWSVPFFGSRPGGAGRVLGTFAVYYREPREPTAHDLGVVGRAAYLAGVAVERDRGEAALRESETRLRLATEAAQLGTWDRDLRSPRLVWSAAEERLMGFEPGTFPGTYEAFLALVHPGDVPALAAAQRRAREAGGEYHAELRFVRPDGSVRWGLVRGQILYGADGRPERMVGVQLDITDRKAAEERVRESEERLQLALAAARLGVWEWDAGADAVFWSPESAHILGADAGAGPLASFTAALDPADAARLAAGARDALAAGTVLTAEFRVVRPSGEVRWVTAYALPRSDPAGAARLVGVVQDVTDRRRAEDELRLRDRAMQAVSQGITISDPTRPDNPIVYASPGFERLTGYATSEVVGRNCRFLQGKDTDPAAVALLRAAIGAGRPCAVELLNYRKDGTPFWNALTIAPVRDDAGRVTHYVGAQTDVSERRRLEAQLLHSQKMEAVGRLAGGIAHDFNNLLTVIIGYSDLMIDSLNPADPLCEALVEVRDAGRRGAGLTRQLLAFSRKMVVVPVVVDANALLTDMGKLLGRLIGEDIDLRVVPAADLWRVRVDPGQLEQVVMNLVVNSRDAMPRGGRLTVETRNVELDAVYAASHQGTTPGRFVLLAVSDTGHGMDEATQARIFEPFFTTKPADKGTGLGLATVYGIVQQSGGRIEVYSEVGVGTTFKVYLPAVEGDVALRSEGGRPLPRRGTETVLVVEDEDGLRTLARLILEKHGYTVLEAANGGEAVLACQRHAGPIHLLVSDMVMPNMSGVEVARHVAELRPEVKVLFLSGYADDAIVRHGFVGADVPFLQKPFSPTALANKVREVLG